MAGGKQRVLSELREHTSDLVAQQFVDGQTEVATLQEVAVNNSNARGQDYNREIQTDIFAQTSMCPGTRFAILYGVRTEACHLITDANADQAMDAQSSW